MILALNVQNVVTLKEKKQQKRKKLLPKMNLIFSLLAFEGDEGEDTNPTTKIDCEKCGHDEAVAWMFQTRSADEPTTRFLSLSKNVNTLGVITHKVLTGTYSQEKMN